MSTTDHARELLEGLHLQAHESGPTTDLSTHFRRAQRLWTAQRDDQEAAGFTEWVAPWADLTQAERLAIAGLVSRAVQDVLEAEQVMCRALEAVLARAEDDMRSDALHLEHDEHSRETGWRSRAHQDQATGYVAAITNALEGRA